MDSSGYIQKNQDRFLAELCEFMSFASVSAQEKHQNDVRACANWLADHFKNMGLTVEIIETPGNPIIKASVGKGLRKIVIYGHYDVQPPEPLELWQSKPFDPEIRDGYLYGRGASDDKGQLFAHVKAVETLIKQGFTPDYEIIFVIEGEEECNGESLEKWLVGPGANLKPEAVFISDCSMYNETTPAITYGLRGICALEIGVFSASRDLHSGCFGGAVANPAIVLSRMLAHCVTQDGRIMIPDFYEDVVSLTDQERETFAALKHDDQKFAAGLGLVRPFGEACYTTLERLWARPTFEINGLWSGYTGPGNKTIIPSSAHAKITMRLVPNQDPKKIFELTRKHLQAICPNPVRLEVKGPTGLAPGVLIDTNCSAVQTAQSALKAAFGNEAVLIREGGSIPVVASFVQQWQCPVVLMGLGLAADSIHAPNERFKIDNFLKGIEAGAILLSSL